MTDQDASNRMRLLQAFRQLVENFAWTAELKPKLDALYEEHRDNCAALHLTAAQRSEHVHAVDALKTLRGFCAKRIKDLDGEIRKHVGGAREADPSAI